MKTTNEMEIVECEECEGTRMVYRSFHCGGCDHAHIESVTCPECDGEGVRAYFKTEFDPECRYCVEGIDHPIWFSLPMIQATRGPIQFFPPQ